MNKMLTPKEVAARLAISRATAARLIADGTIPVLVLADRSRRRLLRVREDALERYLCDCERSGASNRQPA